MRLFSRIKNNYFQDRRRIKRKSLVCPIKVYSKDGRESLAKGFVTDLSEYGIKILTQESLSLGDEFSFHFSLSNGWNLDFWGTVVYFENAILSKAYGIKFSPGQSTFILKLL